MAPLGSTAADLAERLLAGDKRALARAISLVEDDDPEGWALVREVFPLTPSGIIRHLDLRRPIYRKTASGGHFGRSEPEFTWERTDKVDALRQLAGSLALA